MNLGKALSIQPLSQPPVFAFSLHSTISYLLSLTAFLQTLLHLRCYKGKSYEGYLTVLRFGFYRYGTRIKDSSFVEYYCIWISERILKCLDRKTDVNPLVAQKSAPILRVGVKLYWKSMPPVPSPVLVSRQTAQCRILGFFLHESVECFWLIYNNVFYQKRLQWSKISNEWRKICFSKRHFGISKSRPQV